MAPFARGGFACKYSSATVVWSCTYPSPGFPNLEPAWLPTCTVLRKACLPISRGVAGVIQIICLVEWGLSGSVGDCSSFCCVGDLTFGSLGIVLEYDTAITVYYANFRPLRVPVAISPAENLHGPSHNESSAMAGRKRPPHSRWYSYQARSIRTTSTVAVTSPAIEIKPCYTTHIFGYLPIQTDL